MSKENQKSLRKQIIPYEKSNLKASIWQMINTFIPFILLWYLAYKSISISVVLTIFIDVVAALFLIRIFIIFHDCCHQSFFKNKTANKVLGTITGVVTLFPFSQWKHSHSIHHATSGNLDKRGIGDMWVLTVEEYIAAPLITKIQYRLYRNPLIMFGLGPIYIVLISNRFNTKNAKLKERLNTYLTNSLIVGVSALFCYTIGWQNYLLVEGPIFFISAVLGIWLFYVQHQFEDTYFEEDENWEYVKAAVEGSSFYKLPKLLQWITGNIGYHHVHHLSPRVPNYNLETVHNNTLPLQNVPTITLKTSLTSLKFKLWDEETKQFVRFKDLKTVYKVNRESSDTV
ncbi:fatty acid desaturase [Bacillus sp. AFS055030]|uniref:fatty acid desaturase n=1 Tax=Bacillus sp. AFS055030 TaxID=2033507 RepID=UPI000BFB2225|nr:fatty acid desaturase [Bacillus sp. AFS055030]PGL71153.1 fatty acid desaturase [Bacillus sp. AFS055030]